MSKQLFEWVKASEELPTEEDCQSHIIVLLKGFKYKAHFHQDNKQFDVSNGSVTLTYGSGNYGGLEWLRPVAALQGEPTDMTVQEFYSGFNLSFLSDEEKETIYTATEWYAKGKVRVALAGIAHQRSKGDGK